jgi:DNA-binding Lrp family transcriptional regulator
MPEAYVLIVAELGKEDEVLKDVQKTEGVEEVFVTYGVYDLIAKIKADSMKQLKEQVTLRLRKKDNITSTLTLILIQE